MKLLLKIIFYPIAGLIGLIVLVAMFLAFNDSGLKNTSSVQEEAKWQFFASIDEMTGKVSYYATSPSIKPRKVMDFPYSNVESWIGVGCETGQKWMYFGFTISPNLLGDNTESGYNWLETRIKIDEKQTNVYLSQSWGAKTLHVGDGGGSRMNKELISKAELISYLPKANKILLELNWHGNGNVYFAYPMTGSANALAKLNSSCVPKKYPPHP